MSADILTAEQYRNKRRLQHYLDRARDERTPLEHAQQAARGLRVIEHLRLFFSARERASATPTAAPRQPTSGDQP